ncbi:S41 family peptidase [Pseudoalteromonas sp. S16_S37]|uniref:S41 family peptidase n=1 Tax=Pseudoalteromonas sp. S16_S37 TaxID=2720228 RepID=UPI0016815B17|nr:S41 family peptidase [Pseudoalteromonas sp. S16_S37]MBD1583962.1 hypothetical protein [Pseudoalteromonas sp. S16_S37]
MKKTNFISICLLSVLACTQLTGCGGGGGGTTNNLNNGQTPSLPDATWQAGAFKPASTFANYCENPRAGIDPYENKPYPDKAGSQMLEKMWARSFSHETYLWYDELPDPNPSDFDSTVKYFDTLRTSAKTPSGKDKDQFHYTESYEDFQKESQSGVVAGYGVRWKSISSKPPRILKVAFTQDNSPAALAGLQRGDQVVAIDGIDFNTANVDEINKLRAGLAPKPGESHVFTISRLNADTGSVEQLNMTLVAGDIESTPVQNAHIKNVNGRNIGYVQFNQFIAVGQRPLIEAFKSFANNGIDDLVLDLRYNGGGLVDMAAQLGYMLAGPTLTQASSNSNGKVFSATTYNDKLSAQNTYVHFGYRAIDWSKQIYLDEVLPSVKLNTVYILATEDTCSASELVINGLRGIDVNVVLIGSQTCGKPYGFYPTPNCGEVFYTVQFRSENAKQFGDYADGFTPVPSNENNTELGLSARITGCQVEDDLSHPLGSANEAMYAAAITHIQTGQCPEPTMNQQNVAAKGAILDMQGPALELPTHPLRNGAVLLNIKEQQ